MISIPFRCPPKVKDCETLRATMVVPDDIHSIRQLISRTFAADPVTQDYWMSLIRSSPTIVLRRGDEIIGFSNIQARDKYRKVANINLIGVDPNYQGQGYGSVLIDLSEGISKTLDRKVIQLHTEQRKPENVAFYSKHGFRVIDVIPRYYGVTKGDGVHMEKILTASVFRPEPRKKKRRPPRKKRGHKCANVFGEFPRRIRCENLSEVVPYFGDIRGRITDTKDPSEIGCLNRMANQISSQCQNRLAKSTVLSLKREINGLAQRQMSALKGR